jgi:D-beta-D-heptose 7-phosphate kinase / D-beta-D-heptose 1-phosphate adenosyltransferase
MNYSSIIDKFKGLRILVVGDAMIDHYIHGRVDRISPEAPIPVFVSEREESRPGGAANVKNQLDAWGCQTAWCFPKKKSIKHRYLVGSHQLFRHDEDSHEKDDVKDFQEIALETIKAVVLSDYNKGFLTEEACRFYIKVATKRLIPVVVDPKGKDWSKYKGATVICPNVKEFNDYMGASGVFMSDKQAAKRFKNMVVKCGADGIGLNRETFPHREHIPAHKVPVFDVTGAGDTVVAMIAAGLAAGADLRTSAIMANAAASVVVQKVGTSVCTLEELRCALGLPTAVLTDFTKDTSTSSESASGSAITSSSQLTMTPTAHALKEMTDPSKQSQNA